MPTGKQIEQIRIGVFFFNGEYRAFHLADNNSNFYPVTIPVWDAVFNEELEFLGQPTTRSLTGFERANPSGYRARVNLSLNNSTPSDSNKIKKLIELLSNQFTRTVFSGTATGMGTTQIGISEGAQGAGADDYYKNLIAVNAEDTTKQARVVSYSKTSQTLTVSNALGSGSSILLQARPNIPSVVGVSTDGSDGNLIFCNLIGGTFGMRRDFTVNLQNINMDLTEIDRTRLISDKFRVE